MFFCSQPTLLGVSPPPWLLWWEVNWLWCSSAVEVEDTAGGLRTRTAGTTGASFLINGDPETDFEINTLLRFALAALTLNWWKHIADLVSNRKRQAESLRNNLLWQTIQAGRDAAQKEKTSHPVCELQQWSVTSDSSTSRLNLTGSKYAVGSDTW